MQKVILLVAGLGLLGFGGYRQLMGGGVDAAAQARCEAQVRETQGGAAELLAACSDPGMVAMMDAQATNQTAQEAAASIAAANQGDFSAHILDWGMIGAGLVLVAGAALPRRRQT